MFNQSIRSALACALFSLLGCPLAVVAQPRELRFNPRKLMAPLRAITDAPVVSVEKADAFVGEDELVLGVVVNDEARAYPINMLTGPRREIVNDKLGKHPIAATW